MQWKLMKNKKILTNYYVRFCSSTMLTSKVATEIIENYSEFCGSANRCNKFVSSQSNLINHKIMATYGTVMKRPLRSCPAMPRSPASLRTEHIRDCVNC